MKFFFANNEERAKCLIGIELKVALIHKTPPTTEIVYLLTHHSLKLVLKREIKVKLFEKKLQQGLTIIFNPEIDRTALFLLLLYFLKKEKLTALKTYKRKLERNTPK